MDYQESILTTIRRGVGLNVDDDSFDVELLTLTNTAIAEVNQNGVGNSLYIIDDTTTWNDMINQEQVEGNTSFAIAITYIILSVKMLFDPPPPSAVEYHRHSLDKLIWRLKIAYEGGD